MTTTRLALCAALTALFVSATPTLANAQNKSRASGFFLGGTYEGTAAVVEDSDVTESGAGAGLIVGYGFTQRLAVFGQFSGASIESSDGLANYGLGHFDAGMRVHFLAPAKRVVPFAQVGLSGRAFSQDIGVDTVEGGGAGVSFGGGVNVHFKPALALTTGVTWATGDIGNIKFNGTSVSGDNSFGLTTARVYVGIIWFPQSK